MVCAPVCAAAASAEKKEPAPPALGRPSNNVKMGIVGMPNVGKSTMFNLLSKQNVPAENYPFCTIDPNVAKVAVPDKRFDYLCDVFKPVSKVCACLTVTDIAGLVKGASEGKGLGNAFLSHISAVDAIYHVVRGFKDEDIEHVEGSVDPVRDLQIISDELLAKDKVAIATAIDALKKFFERGQKDKNKKDELEVLLKVEEWMKQGKDVRSGEWNAKEIEVLNRHLFLTAKPVVYLLNIRKDDFEKQKSKWLQPVKEWVKQRSPGSTVLPFSAKFEADLDAMPAEDRPKYLEANKVQSMLPKIIWAGYTTLGLIHYFTCGADEVKCWTILRGTKAPQAAGVIHTDFERGFICAETMGYEDFKELKSEAACKAAGKYRMQGKEYVVHDGDILFFKFNVAGGAGAKKK